MHTLKEIFQGLQCSPGKGAKFFFPLALILLTFIIGCFDFQEAHVANPNEMSKNFPPVIDQRYVSPQPSDLANPISLGESCTGVALKIPPIKDFDRDDRFHYLWFFNGRLIDKGILEAESRKSAVISLTLDKQKLEHFFEGKLDDYFFTRLHIVKFLASDREYLIPENAYLGENTDAQEDSTYWSIRFSNEPC